MDEALARIVIGTAVRAAREIGDLAPLLKEHAASEVHEEIKLGVGTAVHEIYKNILEPVFKRFPALKVEFESNIERYGTGA